MFSISILLLSIVLTIFSLNIKIKPKKTEIIFTLIMISIFSAFMAIRSVDIPDTYWYMFSFIDIDPRENYTFSFFRDNSAYGFEYGYILLMQIFKLIFSTNYQVFFYFCSFITSVLFVFSIKEICCELFEINDVNYPLLFCIYSAYFGLYYCGIAIRAGLAIGLILFAMTRVIKNKYVSVVILSVIAMSFHRMSIVGVILIIIFSLLRIKFKKKILLVAWIIIGILIFSGIAELFFPFTADMLGKIFSRYVSIDYTRYLRNGGKSNEAGFAVFFDWLIGLVIIVRSIDSKAIKRLFNIYLIGFIIIVFTLTIPGFSRISDYFTVVNIPMLYYTINIQKSNKTMKIIMCIVIVGLNVVRVLNRYGWV